MKWYENELEGHDEFLTNFTLRAGINRYEITIEEAINLALFIGASEER